MDAVPEQLLVRVLVDPHPPWLHDPKSTHGGFSFDDHRELLHEIPHRSERGTRMTENDEPGVLVRREVEDLGEVDIQCDEASVFRLTSSGEFDVSDTAEGLLARCRDMVSTVHERITPTRIHVLVELESHDATSMGRTRSRVSSAA